MTFENKAVLVCGGASGIGAETARRLAGAGARVAIGDINEAAAQSVAEEIAGAGGEAIARYYDQAEEASIQDLVQQACGHFGRIHGVFANAADLSIVLEDQDVLVNPAAVWDRTLKVNLTGTALVIKASLEHLLSHGGGSIVCTSSSASTMGEEQRPAYAASKAGVNALCRHVASRWGKRGIRCNAIAPGLVVTDNIRNSMPADLLENVARFTRSPRLGEPADIAAAAAFLLSDDAQWVNGQVWHVNGGVWYAN
jgi:NAD(P)-dependent dehydrogenase (short-subunit alcohol dehydrogenase family)